MGDAAACMNQSSTRKSLSGLFSVAASCGHDVPGNRRRNPAREPKYCQDKAGSRSKLLANIGSKCDDHAIAACNSASAIFIWHPTKTTRVVVEVMMIVCVCVVCIQDGFVCEQWEFGLEDGEKKLLISYSVHL